MTRRTRWYRSREALGVVVAVLLAWWLVGHFRSASPASDPAADPAAVHAAHDRATIPSLNDPRARSRGRVPFAAEPALGGEVEISGRVVDLYTAAPVADTEVVLLSAGGEASAITGADGHYSIRVTRGMYRAYVRSDAVMTLGRRQMIRIPGAPSADAVDAPDQAAMAVVLATADTDHVDLPVVRAGVIVGRVVDSQGGAVAGAIVQAASDTRLRPVLGTDLAETGRDGSFTLRVPAGDEVLTASHPRFAGVQGEPQQLTVAPGTYTSTLLTLAAGCIVTGRVVRADGSPAADGAIERKWGDGANQFGPDAQIAADGTFRWAGTEDGPVALRAWPWKSPPSLDQTFSCRSGARFAGVVFRIPDEAPAVSGTVREADGEPASVYLHLEQVDQTAPPFGGAANRGQAPVVDGKADQQQERSDSDGNWAFYHLPPGRYRVSVVSERGVAMTELSVPQTGVALSLSGTGSVHGSTKLPDGTMQVSVVGCEEVASAGGLTITRLVPVHGGQFQLDGVPACHARMVMMFTGHRVAQTVDVTRDEVAALEVDLDSNQPVIEGEAEAEGEADHDSEGDDVSADTDTQDDTIDQTAPPFTGNGNIREPLRRPVVMPDPPGDPRE